MRRGISRSLQILRHLRNGEASGRELRQVIEPSMSRPAFYALMSSLEDHGLVYGGYVIVEIDGVPVKERRYTRSNRTEGDV